MPKSKVSKTSKRQQAPSKKGITDVFISPIEEAPESEEAPEAEEVKPVVKKAAPKKKVTKKKATAKKKATLKKKVASPAKKKTPKTVVAEGTIQLNWATEGAHLVLHVSPLSAVGVELVGKHLVLHEPLASQLIHSLNAGDQAILAATGQITSIIEPSLLLKLGT